MRSDSTTPEHASVVRFQHSHPVFGELCCECSNQRTTRKQRPPPPTPPRKGEGSPTALTPEEPAEALAKAGVSKDGCGRGVCGDPSRRSLPLAPQDEVRVCCGRANALHQRQKI